MEKPEEEKLENLDHINNIVLGRVKLIGDSA